MPWDSKIIYITPRLSECTRIHKACEDKDFHSPSLSRGDGNKSVDFLDLIKKGENIASTHVLFSKITDEMVEQIKNNNYILILDEVMDVVTRINIYDDTKKTDEEKSKLMKEDIKGLLDSGTIRINEDYSVEWVNNDIILNKYSTIKNLANRGLLYMVDDDLVVWTFPIEVFREGIFEKIFILTYMFDYQIQAYYYKFFGLQFQKYFVKKTDEFGYEIYDWNESYEYDVNWRKSIADKVHICDNYKLNKIGAYYEDAVGRVQCYALSKNWYRKASKDTIDLLNRNMSNYFKNLTKSKTTQRMWTCFKQYKRDFKSNKELSRKSWVELNARAINEFGDRDVLIYPINRYLNPFYERFFAKKNIKIDNDSYALSEFIQWTFRSAIRNGKDIWIYIPSQRMREMFENWLGGENLYEPK